VQLLIDMISTLGQTISHARDGLERLMGLVRGRSVVISMLEVITCNILLLTGFPAAPVHQKPQRLPFGIAWQVKGAWKEEGQDRAISSGDAVRPGSLLRPGEATGRHSILVLLPDGQRILYECFLAEDCARSFRVPSLYRRPAPFAVDLLARIHEVLIRRKTDAEFGTVQKHRLPRDEVLTVLEADKQVQIGGLAAALPNGHYTYNLQPLNHEQLRQFQVALEKTKPFVTLALPSSGLYDLTIFDQWNNPRIDLFVAAIEPEQKAKFVKQFADAKALLGDWDEDYQGWPIHDLQRAYLESLLLDIKPQSGNAQVVTTSVSTDSTETAEPRFLPRPGVFDGDTGVTLHCDTPGAVIHYTFDGSQPLNGSPVYAAPIMVKGTELTIKAFATAPGKKDSAVVTGIFRIKDDN